MSLIGLLVFILIMGLVYYLITLIPLPPPFRTIALVVLVLICIIWLLNGIGVFHGVVIR